MLRLKQVCQRFFWIREWGDTKRHRRETRFREGIRKAQDESDKGKTGFHFISDFEIKP